MWHNKSGGFTQVGTENTRPISYIAISAPWMKKTLHEHSSYTVILCPHHQMLQYAKGIAKYTASA